MNGDFLLAFGENVSKLSVDLERGVHDAFFRSGELLPSFMFLRSSIIGVVSPEVKLLYFPSRLIVGLSTKLSELHSSDVGETMGVSVLGVTEPGLKNVSKPSPILCDGPSASILRVGALVLARLGRLFTKCCNCNDVLGNSVMESQSSFCISVDESELRCDGDSSKSGIFDELKFVIPKPTTDWGRTLRATERRLF
jgi:hypothetical protein